MSMRAPTPKVEAARKKILVVDDDQDAADALATLLKVWGYEVGIAASGPAALSVAQANEIWAAIVDIGLPEMDGYEVARRLRAVAKRPLFLVALSGYSEDTHREMARAAGFDEYLVKPAPGASIRAALERMPRGDGAPETIP